MELRRCREDRYDFTEKDNAAVFPIQLTKGGPTFGFCPAKILRDDPVAADIYTTLVAILETGVWPKAGGIEDQDDYWVDMVAQFGPMRRTIEFSERFKMVAGSISGGNPKGGGTTKGAKGGNNTRTPPNRNRG